MTASYSNPGSVKYLQRKIENQAKKLTEMGELLKTYKEKLANIKEQLRIKDIICNNKEDDIQFLKSRVVQIYGKKALEDIFKHIDNPNLRPKKDIPLVKIKSFQEVL